MTASNLAALPTPGTAPDEAKQTRPRRWPKYVKVGIGGSLLLLFCLIALFAPLIAPHDPGEQVLENRLLPPAWHEDGSMEHILGTDHLGRDLASRIIYGSRISLLVAFTAVFFSGIIGCLLGLVSGYYRGWVDTVVGKLVEVFQSVPFLLMAIAMMAFMGQGLWNVILVLVINRWTQYTRVVRSEVLSLREREFVQAATSLGASGWRIILRHLLPNALNSITVIATFAVATVVLSEASLSYLGVGVPPEVPTWGAMLSEGRSYIYRAVWITLYPGLAIFLTVLSVNLLGDGLRDLLDPRKRRS